MPQVSVVLRDGRIKQMEERFANVLIRLGRASLAPVEKAKPRARRTATVTLEDETPKPQRTYRRRDMQAEDSDG